MGRGLLGLTFWLQSPGEFGPLPSPLPLPFRAVMTPKRDVPHSAGPALVVTRTCTPPMELGHLPGTTHF